MGLTVVEANRLARDRSRWRIIAIQKLGCQRALTTVFVAWALSQVSQEGTSYSLVQTLLLYRMRRLATVHSVTDRQTDRQTTV